MSERERANHQTPSERERASEQTPSERERANHQTPSERVFGQTINTVVNGLAVSRYVENRTLLADFLRGDLGLTGTKVSCELQVCGVCSVLVDGRPISACTYLAVDIDGQTVETVEGLADENGLSPLQESFVDNFALQCGFCTPGFLMMSKNLLDENPHPSHDEVVHHLEGNICRCTGYRPIVEAVLEVSKCPGAGQCGLAHQAGSRG